MHPFLARILDKPVCAILDGCQNFYNKLSVAVPSLFGPTIPENSLQLRYRVKKNIKPQPPKKPQRGIMRAPTFLSNQRLLLRYVLDEIDYVYRYNRMPTLENRLAMELKGPYENVQRPPTEPNWLFATDDLSDSLIGVRKVRPSNELPPETQEDSDLDEEITEIDLPRNHYKHLIRLMGFYYPEPEDEVVDDFILISSDDDDEDDDYA